MTDKKPKINRKALPKKPTPAVENIEAAVKSNRGLSQLIISCYKEIKAGKDEQKLIADQRIKPAKRKLKENGYSIGAMNAWVKWLDMDKEERLNHFEDIKIIGDGLGEQMDLFGKPVEEIAEAELEAKKTTPEPEAELTPENVALQRQNDLAAGQVH